MILADYNEHLCPECGHKIGIHTDSTFGHNPLNNFGLECNRTHNGLVIEKLTAWWKDALSERDAYMKSYEEECKKSSDYFDAFLKMTGVASNAVRDRDMYRKKLEMAMKAFDDILEFKRTGYFGLNFDVWQIIKKAMIEIENIK
jgi:hypothetical protein